MEGMKLLDFAEPTHADVFEKLAKQRTKGLYPQILKNFSETKAAAADITEMFSDRLDDVTTIVAGLKQAAKKFEGIEVKLIKTDDNVVVGLLNRTVYNAAKAESN